MSLRLRGGHAAPALGTKRAPTLAFARPMLSVRPTLAIQGASIYITHTPCIHCLKTLVNTGVRRVFYGKAYKIDTIEEIRDRSGVTLVQIELPPT